jgi:hypothetical protein
MNKIVKLLMAVIIIAASGTLSSCKKTFDNPPGPADPAIVANTSVAALKALHTSSGAYNIKAATCTNNYLLKMQPVVCRYCWKQTACMVLSLLAVRYLLNAMAFV